MTTINDSGSRRSFLRTTAAVSAGAIGLGLTSASASSSFSRLDEWSIVGPREGFSPHVGTLYSMLSMMRHLILRPVQGLTIEQLDYLHDAHSNSIGSMLWHLAATERYYQLNTFDDMKWGSWSDEIKKKWDVPMRLGADARKEIKGHNLQFYLDILEETRANTIAELKKRDDDWLMQVDSEWGWNNYAKWFHVAEHESNHNGQIKWIKNRLPGAKPSGD